MKKYLLSILTVVFVAFQVSAQLFKPADIAKISDYVVKELELNGLTAQSVKSIYATYGEKMRAVSESKEGLNAKQSKLTALTSEMDEKVIEKLPKNKVEDYKTVTNHYRKKGIATSALAQSSSNNTKAAENPKVQETADKVEMAKEISENLKAEFKKELGVDDEQADQLTKITFEHNLQKRIINQTFKTDPVTKSQKMNELNTNTNTKVKKILNDQQYKKFLIILIKSAQNQ